MTKGGESLKIKKKDDLIISGKPLSYYQNQLNRKDLDKAHKDRLKQILKNPLKFGITKV